MPQLPKKPLGIPEKLTDGLGLGISFDSNPPQLIVTFGKFDDVYCYLVAIYLQTTKVHYILEQGKTREALEWGETLVKIKEALPSATFHYLGDDPLPPVTVGWLRLRINFSYSTY